MATKPVRTGRLGTTAPNFQKPMPKSDSRAVVQKPISPLLQSMFSDDADEPVAAPLVGPELKLPQLQAPPGFFNITAKGDARRVVIIDRIEVGHDNWKDLLCYDHKTRSFVHLKCEDLVPISQVAEAIAFIRTMQGET